MANVRGFVVPMRQVEHVTKNVTGHIERQNRSWTSLARTVIGVGVAYKGLSASWRLLKASMSTALEFERVEASLEALIGNADKARRFMEDLQSFSLATPFTFKEVLDAAKQMKAFGFETEQILPNLAMLGEIATGTGQALGDIVFPFAQAMAEVKQQWRDIRQFATRGIPLTEAIAKTMGKGVREVRKLSEAGELNFPIVQAALKSLVVEGGLFHGQMEKISQTTFGVWQRFKDLSVFIKRDIGAAIIEVFKLRDALLGAFNRIGDIVTSGLFKEAVKAALIDIRDMAIWAFGGIETAVRMGIQKLGQVLETLAHSIMQVGDLLAAIPIIGKSFSRNRTIEIPQRRGEGEADFLNRVQREVGELQRRGAKVLSSSVEAGPISSFVGTITDWVAKAMNVTNHRALPRFYGRIELAQASVFHNAMEGVAKIGRAWMDLSTDPSLAMSADKLMRPDAAPIVLKTFGEMIEHMRKNWTTFLSRIKFLATMKNAANAVRRDIGGYIVGLINDIKLTFSAAGKAFDDLVDMLDDAEDEIRKLERPVGTLMDQVRAGLAAFPQLGVHGDELIARAQGLDSLRRTLEETKRLWDESKKIIENTKSPMEQLQQAEYELNRTRWQGWITYEQQERTIQSMAKKLFDIADVEIDPFKAMIDREKELRTLLHMGAITSGQFEATMSRDRDKLLGKATASFEPFGAFRFATGPNVGAVRGADMPDLLQQQLVQQRQQVKELAAVKTKIEDMLRLGIPLRIK
ncbi:MAG: tape measure protein [Candidatus Nanopelagicales bacterium]|nr:tape measure protein [Candidatus Nanopelagicales bacterium]